MKTPKGFDFRMTLAMVWMLFTLALALWLLTFQTHLLKELQLEHSVPLSELVRHHRMIVYEMATLIFSLLIGGGALFYLIWQEKNKSHQIQSFFAVFAHELRTSLSRLRIQAESIQTDPQKLKSPHVLLGLLDEATTLELHLENSLWVARAEKDQFLTETLELASFLASRLAPLPITLHLKNSCFVQADSRALESILKNIVQNAIQHGHAENLWIQCENLNSEQVQISFQDDGKGFDGPIDRLGTAFSRHTPTSGTGLGLYLIQKLSRLMRGKSQFCSTTQGFKVELALPGQTVKVAQR